MTKRFDYTNYDDGTESIYDRKEDKYYFDSEFCKLDEVLNELSEENEGLKSTSFYMLNWIQNKCPKYYKYFERIVRGDVRIGDVNARLMQEVSEYSRKAKELEKENEQLKKTLEAVAYEMIDFQRKKLNEELLEVLDDFSSIDDLKKALKKGLVEYD